MKIPIVKYFEIKDIPGYIHFIAVNSNGLIRGFKERPQLIDGTYVSRTGDNSLYLLSFGGDEENIEPKLFYIQREIVGLKELKDESV